MIPRFVHFRVLLTALTIVVTLLLCPAVTRIVRVQRIDSIPTQTYTPSFQRSLHVPPEPHVVLPDTHIVLHAIGDDLMPPRITRWLQPADELLPRRPALSSPRSLRAPPSA